MKPTYFNGLVKTSFLNERKLPLVVEPAGTARGQEDKRFLFDFLASQELRIEQALLDHGAILLRGFALRSAEDFSEAMETFVPNRMVAGYSMGRGQKQPVLKRIYTSTEIAPPYRIPLHNEMTFTPIPPRYIVFFCERPAPQGGETPLACSREMYREMPEDIKRLFDDKGGVMYVRYHTSKNWPIKLRRGNIALQAWQDTFETDDPAAVEAACNELGMTCQWSRLGELLVEVVLPATGVHPVTEEKTWFNQAHLFNPTRDLMTPSKRIIYKVARALLAPRRFTYACFGNRERIPDEVVERIHQTIERITIKFPWAQGDMLVIDNASTSHGRNPFSGPRSVLVGMK